MGSRDRSSAGRPGLVFVHGGFAFGAADWEQTLAFRTAGFVVLAPILRGENGSAGEYEAFYGEVDDVIAADRYLAKLPCVDKSRIFLCGHSTGGTLTMLAAMMPSPFRAAASIGGSPDQDKFFQSLPECAPFDRLQEAEIALRSPIRFPASLRCPLYVMVGLNDYTYQYQSRQLAEAAQSHGHQCEYLSIEGDHYSSVEPAIEQAVGIFSVYSD